MREKMTKNCVYIKLGCDQSNEESSRLVVLEAIEKMIINIYNVCITLVPSDSEMKLGRRGSNGKI